MIERRIEVTTSEGEMPTFVFHPTHGGPHPVVLYLMDAPVAAAAATFVQIKFGDGAGRVDGVASMA